MKGPASTLKLTHAQIFVREADVQHDELSHRWLDRTLQYYRGGVDLFCLPRAGCGLNQFGRWPPTVGDITVRVLRFPGDYDPLWWAAYASFTAQASDLVADLGESLPGRFALFGHGSSALVAYEAAAELARRGMTAPVRLIVSGSRPPQHARVAGPLPSDSALEEAALVACLEIGGNPLPSLVEASARALRAEAIASRAYEAPAPTWLSCPITAISWAQDSSADQAAMAAWAECGATTFVTLDGSRYRYAQAPPELLKIIAFPDSFGPEPAGGMIRPGEAEG